MNEKLLGDYIYENDLNKFDTFSIKNIRRGSGCVMFMEIKDKFNPNSHCIDLLDIIAWVYDKTIQGGE